MTPSELMVPQGSSVRAAGAASVRDQIREPVKGSNAITSLFWVETSSRSCPPSPPSQYSGWAKAVPAKEALKAKSWRSRAAAARVSDGSTYTPVRVASLWCCRTAARTPEGR